MPSLNTEFLCPSEFHLLLPNPLLCLLLTSTSLVKDTLAWASTSPWRAIPWPLLSPKCEHSCGPAHSQDSGEAYEHSGDGFKTFGYRIWGSWIPKSGLEGEVWALDGQVPWALWLIVLSGEGSWRWPKRYPLRTEPGEEALLPGCFCCLLFGGEKREKYLLNYKWVF